MVATNVNKHKCTWVAHDEAIFWRPLTLHDSSAVVLGVATTGDPLRKTIFWINHIVIRVLRGHIHSKAEHAAVQWMLASTANQSSYVIAASISVPGSSQGAAVPEKLWYAVVARETLHRTVLASVGGKVHAHVPLTAVFDRIGAPWSKSARDLVQMWILVRKRHLETIVWFRCEVYLLRRLPWWLLLKGLRGCRRKLLDLALNVHIFAEFMNFILELILDKKIRLFTFNRIWYHRRNKVRNLLNMAFNCLDGWGTIECILMLFSTQRMLLHYVWVLLSLCLDKL